MPDKTMYYQKEFFDKTGLEISGTTSTGETVDVTDYEISGTKSLLFTPCPVTQNPTIFALL